MQIIECGFKKILIWPSQTFVKYCRFSNKEPDIDGILSNDDTMTVLFIYIELQRIPQQIVHWSSHNLFHYKVNYMLCF